jgi:lysozyme
MAQSEGPTKLAGWGQKFLSAKLISDTKRSEGTGPMTPDGRFKAYLCPAGYWTVGWGRNLERDLKERLSAEEKERRFGSVTIGPEQAEEWIREDIRASQTEAEALPEWAVANEVRRNAITELIFNMGLGRSTPPARGYLSFKNTRFLMRNQRWEEAADNLLKSKWADQVGKARSGRIAAYIRTGEYQT